MEAMTCQTNINTKSDRRVTSDTVLKILARFKFGYSMVIRQFAKFSFSPIFVLIWYIADPQPKLLIVILECFVVSTDNSKV